MPIPTSSPRAAGCSGPMKMAKDLHAGAANAALEHQEALLPGAELDPARPVVERRDDAVSPGERADRLEDSVAHGVVSPAARAARLPCERRAAGEATRQLARSKAPVRSKLVGRESSRSFRGFQNSTFRALGPASASASRRTSPACTSEWPDRILMLKGKTQLRGRRSTARTRWRAASSGSIILTGR